MRRERKLVISRITVWFSERGYGFLRPGGEGDEENTSGYFLHGHDIVSGTPMKGAVARFEVVVRKKGSSAVNAEVFATMEDLWRKARAEKAAITLADSTTAATTSVEVSK